MNKQRGQTNKQTNKQRDFANQGDTISRHGVYAWLCNMGHEHLADAIMDENRFPSAQPDMAENLYPYKCYITDEDGLQHEVIHIGDIRRVTGWEI